jgi:hypothetical protein
MTDRETIELQIALNMMLPDDLRCDSAIAKMRTELAALRRRERLTRSRRLEPPRPALAANTGRGFHRRQNRRK